MLRIREFFLAGLLVLAWSVPAAAGGTYYTSWGKAIGGYDPVAYFTKGEAVKGSGDFSHEWKGVEWRFASAANLEKFKQTPEKFAPQYGGYCAWAVSQGYSASTDPEAWKIVEGKLYLNYSRSIQRRWEQAGPAKMIVAGDRNWPAIKANLSE